MTTREQPRVSGRRGLNRKERRGKREERAPSSSRVHDDARGTVRWLGVAAISLGRGRGGLASGFHK